MTIAIANVAGFLTTLAFLPQVVRSWRTRSTADLSLSTILAFIVGVSLWIVYGAQIGSYPIVLWNVVTSGLNLALLVAKIRHG